MKIKEQQKPIKRTRNVTLNLRLTEEEKGKLKKVCRAKGLSYTEAVLKTIELLEIL